jgi:hypothetical protein
VSLSDDPKQAINQIRAAEKQLRVMKSQVTAAVKDVNATYRTAIAESTYRPGIGGVLLGSRYRSASRSAGARKKDDLRARRDKVLAPYEEVRNLVDCILSELGIHKAKLAARAQKAASQGHKKGLLGRLFGKHG